jgi:uncharacterized repeat protein (TIGR03943 family)
MNAKVQGVLVASVGLVAAYLAASGAYLAYLKTTMRIPLLAAGMLMLVLGTVTLVRAIVVGTEPDPDSHADAPGHDHGHGRDGPAVAWLLALPLLALVLIDPPALGADAARRDAAGAVAEPAAGSRLGPLPPPRDGAVTVKLADFVTRAYYDQTESLAGVPVRLTGFVVRDPDAADGYQLTRFVMACCAGDALPMQVTVRGLDGPPPVDDTWVEVVGEWIPPDDPTAAGTERGAAIELRSQTEIPEPTYPYE